MYSKWTSEAASDTSEQPLFYNYIFCEKKVFWPT